MVDCPHFWLLAAAPQAEKPEEDDVTVVTLDDLEGYNLDAFLLQYLGITVGGLTYVSQHEFAFSVVLAWLS